MEEHFGDLELNTVKSVMYLGSTSEVPRQPWRAENCRGAR